MCKIKSLLLTLFYLLLTQQVFAFSFGKGFESSFKEREEDCPKDVKGAAGFAWEDTTIDKQMEGFYNKYQKQVYSDTETLMSFKQKLSEALKDLNGNVATDLLKDWESTYPLKRNITGNCKGITAHCKKGELIKDCNADYWSCEAESYLSFKVAQDYIDFMLQKICKNTEKTEVQNTVTTPSSISTGAQAAYSGYDPAAESKKLNETPKPVTATQKLDTEAGVNNPVDNSLSDTEEVCKKRLKALPNNAGRECWQDPTTHKWRFIWNVTEGQACKIKDCFDTTHAETCKFVWIPEAYVCVADTCKKGYKIHGHGCEKEDESESQDAKKRSSKKSASVAVTAKHSDKKEVCDSITDKNNCINKEYCGWKNMNRTCADIADASQSNFCYSKTTQESCPSPCIWTAQGICLTELDTDILSCASFPETPYFDESTKKCVKDKPQKNKTPSSKNKSKAIIAGTPCKIDNAITAMYKKDENKQLVCKVVTCNPNYKKNATETACEAQQKETKEKCKELPANATAGIMEKNGSTKSCKVTACASEYKVSSDGKSCEAKTEEEKEQDKLDAKFDDDMQILHKAFLDKIEQLKQTNSQQS